MCKRCGLGAQRGGGGVGLKGGWAGRPEAGFGVLKVLVEALEVVRRKPEGLLDVLSAADYVGVVLVCVELVAGVELFQVSLQIVMGLLGTLGIGIGR